MAPTRTKTDKRNVLKAALAKDEELKKEQEDRERKKARFVMKLGETPEQKALRKRQEFIKKEAIRAAKIKEEDEAGREQMGSNNTDNDGGFMDQRRDEDQYQGKFVYTEPTSKDDDTQGAAVGNNKKPDETEKQPELEAVDMLVEKTLEKVKSTLLRGLIEDMRIRYREWISKEPMPNLSEVDDYLEDQKRKADALQSLSGSFVDLIGQLKNAFKWKMKEEKAAAEQKALNKKRRHDERSEQAAKERQQEETALGKEAAEAGRTARAAQAAQAEREEQEAVDALDAEARPAAQKELDKRRKLARLAARRALEGRAAAAATAQVKPADDKVTETATEEPESDQDIDANTNRLIDMDESEKVMDREQIRQQLLAALEKVNSTDEHFAKMREELEQKYNDWADEGKAVDAKDVNNFITEQNRNIKAANMSIGDEISQLVAVSRTIRGLANDAIAKQHGAAAAKPSEDARKQLEDELSAVREIENSMFLNKEQILGKDVAEFLAELDAYEERFTAASATSCQIFKNVKRDLVGEWKKSHKKSVMGMSLVNKIHMQERELSKVLEEVLTTLSNKEKLKTNGASVAAIIGNLNSDLAASDNVELNGLVFQEEMYDTVKREFGNYNTLVQSCREHVNNGQEKNYLKLAVRRIQPVVKGLQERANSIKGALEKSLKDVKEWVRIPPNNVLFCFCIFYT
jgi:hypothetical protein